MARKLSGARTFMSDIRKYLKTTGAALDEVVIEFASEVSRELIKASPVDTGRFRANWQVTPNQPADHSLMATDISGNATQLRNMLTIRQMFAGGAAVRSIYFSNMLIYANALEYGHSQQAPFGVVGITQARLGLIMNKAISTVNRRI